MNGRLFSLRARALSVTTMMRWKWTTISFRYGRCDVKIVSAVSRTRLSCTLPAPTGSHFASYLFLVLFLTYFGSGFFFVLFCSSYLRSLHILGSLVLVG